MPHLSPLNWILAPIMFWMFFLFFMVMFFNSSKPKFNSSYSSNNFLNHKWSW